MLHGLDPERCVHPDRIGVGRRSCGVPLKEGDVGCSSSEFRRRRRRGDCEDDRLGDRLACNGIAEHRIGIGQYRLIDLSRCDEIREVLGNSRRVFVRRRLAGEGDEVRRATADDEGRDAYRRDRRRSVDNGGGRWTLCVDGRPVRDGRHADERIGENGNARRRRNIQPNAGFEVNALSFAVASSRQRIGDVADGLHIGHAIEKNVFLGVTIGRHRHPQAAIGHAAKGRRESEGLRRQIEFEDVLIRCRQDRWRRDRVSERRRRRRRAIGAEDRVEAGP